MDAAAPRASRHAWYTLGVLFLIYTFHYVDRAVLSIVLEPLKQDFQLTDGQIGLLTGVVYAITYAVAGVPLGMLIDRTNRRNLLAGLVVIWSGFTALSGMAQNFTHLIMARLAVGAAEAGGAPAAMSMVTDLFPKETRSRALGIFWASTAVAAALTFIVGGLVISAWGWRSAFFIAGAPGLVLGVLLWRTVREPVRGAFDDAQADHEPAPGLPATVRYAVRQPVFVAVFVAMTLNSMTASGVLVWIAAFMLRTQELDIVQAGMVVGIAAGVFGTAGTVLGGILGGRLAARRPAALPLLPAISSLLAGIIGFWLAFAQGLAFAIAAVFLFELTYRAYMGSGYDLLLGDLQPRMRGIASAAMQASTNLIGWGLGPYIVGLVSDAVGGPDSLRYGLAAVMALNLLAAICYGLAWRARRQTHPAIPVAV